MTFVMVWIAPLIMATLCLIFMRIALFAIKLSSVEVAWKDGMKAPNLPKEPITEIFAEPKFLILLCAILASSIQNGEIAVVFGLSGIQILMGSEWHYYLRNSVMITSFFYPFSGAITGYVRVLLWKSMKGHDLISQGWLKVSLLIPFLSIGTLYSIINLEDDRATTFSWHASLVSGFWLSISMLSTQLGGYLGMRSHRICMPIVISKNTRIKNYWAWTTSLLLGFLASLVVNVETYIVAVHAFSAGSKIYFVVMFALSILHLASSWWLWLAFMNMLLCFGNLGCCWWKAFFTLGVPYGLYAGLKLLSFLDHSNYLIELSVLVFASAVIMGSSGVLLVFSYYSYLILTPNCGTGLVA